VTLDRPSRSTAIPTSTSPGKASGAKYQADRVACDNVEQPRLDQPAVHRIIEPAVMDGVVDVPINIIVAPSQRDRRPRPISIAPKRFGRRH
jgi:hypothetical protein